MAGKRRALTFADRVEISTGLKAGWTQARIARHVGRDESVISREITRNTTKTRGYVSVTADEKAKQRRRRPQALKIAADPVLRARVHHDLRRNHSPRAIAGRLRAESGGHCPVANAAPEAQGRTVSHEAVYSYIYALPVRELVRCGIQLDSKRTHRKPRGPKRATGSPIIAMRSIDERPAEVEDRRVPGHWEGDLIIGKNGASAAVTLVERTTRFTTMIALPHGRSSQSVVEAIIEQATGLPQMFARSLTWDQGTEMARHARLTQATGIEVFFAHPHSPWERGTNEHTNRRIRAYLPKGTTIPAHQPYLTAIAEELNNIPRETLQWLTPREAYEQLLASTP